MSDEPENSVKNFTSTRQLMNTLGYAIWELFRNTAPIHLIFLQQLVKAFPFKIYKVQIDNGFEFTKRFSRTKEGDKTLFEEQLLAYGIEYQRIRPYTPRHNGKVERSHRRDNEVFYSLNKFSSFEEFESKLSAWNAFTNRLPMRPLNYKSTVEALYHFL